MDSRNSMERVNIEDMIKALYCLGSQTADGDCYETFFNFGREDNTRMSCAGDLAGTIPCPYHQKTYGVCCEDGELCEWLPEVAESMKELQQYKAIGTLEEVQTAVELRKPKKPNWYKNPVMESGKLPICPTCGTIMVRTEIFGRTIDEHCVSCGQAIDWEGI